MKEKLIKYLIRLGAEPFKTSETGSQYLKVNTSKIRISDHIATSVNDPRTLNVIIPFKNEQLIVIINNRVVIFKDYKKLRDFLRPFVLMAECGRDIRISSGQTVDVTGLSEKQVTAIKNYVANFKKHAKT